MMVATVVGPVFGQPPPPLLPPPALDQLVARIALYPDPLLAQILTAAHWSDQHHYLTGQAVANEIAADQLRWRSIGANAGSGRKKETGRRTKDGSDRDRAIS